MKEKEKKKPLCLCGEKKKKNPLCASAPLW
jgi:hypothetical protein